MAQHYLSEHFTRFFDNINPAQSFETIASSQYNNIKSLIEDPIGLASALSPICFLQGSYRHQTAIHTINDVDIVVLCRALKFPAGGEPGTIFWSRDQIFDTIAAPLRANQLYKNKISYHSGSMCIKLDLGIKVEILPVVYVAASFGDENTEPFYLYRPENSRWELGYARYHRQFISSKNAAAVTQGNFIPIIKTIKHLRSLHGLDAVSFHIESLLYQLPHEVYYGSTPDAIETVLGHLAKFTSDQWYKTTVNTPSGDRDIFTPAEWNIYDWIPFHLKMTALYEAVKIANLQTNRDLAILAWQATLGESFFPKEVN